MGSGFIQMKRTEETKELMKDKNAFTLLAQIALRAKRTKPFLFMVLSLEKLWSEATRKLVLLGVNIDVH